MTGIFTGAFSDMILSKLSSLCCKKFFLKTASLPTCIYLYCTIGSKSWLNLEKHLGHSKHGRGGGGGGGGGEKKSVQHPYYILII